MIKNSSFVAVTSANFGAARRFRVEGTGFAEIESDERPLNLQPRGIDVEVLHLI
jgi:hypothetical protein